jgi:hypothetical protein
VISHIEQLSSQRSKTHTNFADPGSASGATFQCMQFLPISSYLFYPGHLSLLGGLNKATLLSTFCSFKSYNPEKFMSSVAIASVHTRVSDRSWTTAMLRCSNGRYKGVWSGLSLHQVGPRLSISIHQNRMCTFATFGARAALRRCPISSNLGQKYLFLDRSKERLGVGSADLGWTSAFYPR